MKGIGKSTFLLKALLQQNIEWSKKKVDAPVPHLLQNCLSNGFIASVSLAEGLRPKEKTSLFTFILARLAFGIINPKERYDKFLKKFPPETSLDDLINAITGRCASLGFQLRTPTMVVLHIDETNAISNKEFLVDLNRALSSLIFASDIFFLAVQTGVRSAFMTVC